MTSRSVSSAPPSDAAAPDDASEVVCVGVRRARPEPPTAEQIVEGLPSHLLAAFFPLKTLEPGGVGKHVCAICFPVDCGVRDREQPLKLSATSPVGTFAPNGKHLATKNARPHLATHKDIITASASTTSPS